MGLFAVNLITTILVFFSSNQIAASDVNLIGKAISLVLLVIITLLMVEIPILICFLLPQNADKILTKLNVWIQKKRPLLNCHLNHYNRDIHIFSGIKRTESNLEPNYERLKQ